MRSGVPSSVPCQRLKEKEYLSTMIVEVYNAFRKAGVPEDDAQIAARALSDTIDAKLSPVATKADTQAIVAEAMVEIIKWVIGIGFIQAGFVVGLIRFLH